MLSISIRVSTLIVVAASILLSGCERHDPDQLISRAEQALFDKQYRAAVVDLKSVLQQDAENAKARWLLAEVYLAVEDGASAEKELESAMALGVGNDAVLPALAHALWLQQQNDELLDLPVSSGMSLTALNELKAFRALALLAKDQGDAALVELEQVSENGREFPFARYARARWLVKNQDSDAALTEAEALTVDQPDFAPAWTMLGDLYGAQKRFADAESAFTNAINIRPNPLDDRLKRGFARVAQQKFNEAMSDAEFLQKSAPEFALGRYLAGLVHFRLQQPSKAQESLERAWELNPQHFQTTLLLSAVDAELGNANRSRQLAERAVAMQPAFIPARKVAALWYLRDRNGIGAETMLRPIVEANPDDLESKDMLAASLMLQARADEAALLLKEISDKQPDSSAAKLKAGLGLFAAGDAAAGIGALNEARAASPKDPLINTTLVAGLLRQENTYGALQAAQDFVQRKPADPAALNLLASAQLEAGDSEQAIVSFKQAMDLDPGNLIASQMLASIALSGGENEQAKRYVEAGLVIHPDNLGLLLLRAEIARASNDDALNRTSLQRAIDLHPEHLAPRVGLARQSLNDGDPEKALSVLSGIDAANNPDFLLVRAEAYHRLNRLTDAKRDLETLVDLRPNSLQLQVQLARTYEALGDQSGLERVSNRMVELMPDDEQALLAKAQLAITSGRLREARELLDAKGLEPNDDVARLTVWMSLARAEKDPVNEVNYGKQLVDIQPTTRHLVLLSRAHQRLGAMREAERLLVAWLDKNPNDLAALFELANFYTGIDEVDKALERLRKIESLDGNHLYALNNLAWYLRETAPQEAKRFAERALDIAPDDRAVVSTYAAVMTQNGEFSVALRMLDRLIDQDEQTPRLRLRRAEVLGAMGDKDGAKQELEELLASTLPPKVKARVEKTLVELEH